MKFNKYQQLANQTDQQPRSGAIQDHPHSIMVPLLGLAGETGELLAEHKKWLRDGQSYTLFPERVTEELGDFLWYLSNVATKYGFHMGDVALVNHAKASALWGGPIAASTWTDPEHPRADIELDEYQKIVNWTDQQPQPTVFNGGDYEALIPLFGLAGKAGSLLNDYGEWFQHGPHYSSHPEQVKETLAMLVWHLCNVASKHDLHLEDIARYNLEKINRRWGTPSPQREQYKLFDEDYAEHERLPRQMDILIKPDGPGRTVTFVNGNRFGDSLTDNHYEDDGYRFHDIFHLSFASMLGWSPTTRALLRRKRKSSPTVDETEDGGRAMVLEEGISAFVFNYAARRNFLDSVKSVDYKLLRNIRELTEHLEVARRTEADWERAIVTGFEIWRAVRAAGQGHIYADLEKGTIWMADTPPAGVSP